MCKKHYKVGIRAVAEKDAEKLIIFMNDPEVIQNLTTSRPINLSVEINWIKSLEDSDTEVVFAIEAINSTEPILIGTVGLHKIDYVNRTATTGIVIGDKAYWSNGYGTEAFELILEYGFNTLNLHRIDSAAYAFNKRSIGLHKKLGFTREGISRKATYRNGKYHDVVNFGLLKKEYKRLNN